MFGRLFLRFINQRPADAVSVRGGDSPRWRRLFPRNRRLLGQGPIRPKEEWMRPVREKCIICSCHICRDLEARFDLKPFSCRISFPWPKAIIPRLAPFSEETRATLFNLFSVPESYEYVDYSARLNQAWSERAYDPSQPKEMVAFFSKFVDPIRKYQSGEMWVLEEGEYLYCTVGFFDKLQKGDEHRYDLTDWSTTEMASDLSAMRGGLKSSFRDLGTNRPTSISASRVLKRVLRRASSVFR